jgi:type IV pilus assembly protein PilC
MAKYLYKAKNERGEIVTGTVTAQNEFEAEKALLDSKLFALDIMAPGGFRFGNLFQPKITIKDRALFARQLATMISSGMTLTKSLTIVAGQGRTERLKSIYHDIYQDIEEGYSFSSALAKHPEAFDRVFIAIVRSGETTGNMVKVLSDTADRLENDSNFIAKIKGAMLYPAFILCALIVVGTYMMIKVIPQLKGVFEQAGSQLPLVTRMLIAMSDFLTTKWWLALIILIALILALRSWILSDIGSRTINKWQITVPGVRNISIGIYMSRFARILEMLISAGVPLIDALKIVSNTINNQIYEEEINQMIVEVEKGVPLSTPMLKDSDFPQLVGQMVSVGEQTGQLDKVLAKVAEYYEEEADEKIKALSTLIEPIVLIIIGIGVAFLVFAVLMPIYGIAQLQ